PYAAAPPCGPGRRVQRLSMRLILGRSGGQQRRLAEVGRATVQVTAGGRDELALGFAVQLPDPGWGSYLVTQDVVALVVAEVFHPSNQQ
ncbi:hypothetical protein ACWGI8_41655, partial [Streptomyces sp. NPDC054841]